jgi:O-6-methylguanine DNA methyltransferase
MTAIPDRDVVADLARLAVRAPSSLAPRVLARVGLGDVYDRVASPLGEVFVAWNERGVSWVTSAPDGQAFERSFREQVGRPIAPGSMPPRLRGAIERRLSGDRRVRIDLDLRGHTEFEVAVWTKALEIPHGEVRPYGWIAAEIGRPKAVRAVGTALAHNPVPLVVPCHRVVRSDGTIGQYSLGGPAAKRRVLSFEGLDPDRLESEAHAGIRYVGSDTTGIVCLPTCHNARRITARHRVPFHSLAEAARAHYRPCRACRPASGAAVAA